MVSTVNPQQSSGYSAWGCAAAIVAAQVLGMDKLVTHASLYTSEAPFFHISKNGIDFQQIVLP